jgi:hypothetical protein
MMAEAVERSMVRIPWRQTRPDRRAGGPDELPRVLAQHRGGSQADLASDLLAPGTADVVVRLLDLRFEHALVHRAGMTKPASHS